jgi:hypothetical protein
VSPLPCAPRADKITGGCIVRYADRQALVHIYSRDGEAEALHAKVLTKGEARRLAANIARLPKLLGEVSARREWVEGTPPVVVPVWNLARTRGPACTKCSGP